MTLPTSTTNITGFFIIVRGFSFRNASAIARLMIFGSHRDLFFVIAVCHQNICPAHHEQMLNNRAQAQHGKEGQCANDQDHADKERCKEGCRNRKGAR